MSSATTDMGATLQPGPSSGFSRWVALGDSFTAGVDGDEPRWTDELAASLRRANPDTEHFNLAVPKARGQEVAEAQLDPAIELRPDLVSLICGANDVVLSVRPDLDTFAKTFSGMLTVLRAELPQATLVTATYPDVSRFFPLRPRSRRRVSCGILELNSVIRATSFRHGVICVELTGHPEEGVRANYAEDGFHPSAEGHRKAAIAFALALSERLGVELDLTREEI